MNEWEVLTTLGILHCYPMMNGWEVLTTLGILHYYPILRIYKKF
jgi:hypothetical protein